MYGVSKAEGEEGFGKAQKMRSSFVPSRLYGRGKKILFRKWHILPSGIVLFRLLLTSRGILLFVDDLANRVAEILIEIHFRGDTPSCGKRNGFSSRYCSGNCSVLPIQNLWSLKLHPIHFNVLLKDLFTPKLRALVRQCFLVFKRALPRF